MRSLVTMLALALVVVSTLADPSPAAIWPLNGAFLSSAGSVQSYADAVPDGAGGAIAVFRKYAGMYYFVYTQRVDASGTVLWGTGGVQLSTYNGDQSYYRIVSDGVGGAIVVWRDSRSPGPGIYAQRLNASGVAQWNANGNAVCTGTSTMAVEAASDGTGGAIVVWQDARNGNYDLFAQRIDASGIMQWTSNGVAVCAATGMQEYQRLVGDSAGGAIVVWHDFRSNSTWDIYAQRMSDLGVPLWTADGVDVCTQPQSQRYPRIAATGPAEAIVAWEDGRSYSNSEVYAQRLGSDGTALWTPQGEPVLTGTSGMYPDLAADNGGGAFFIWHQYVPSLGNDIYSQHLNASGSSQWSPALPLCTATGAQSDCTIVPDGDGGFIATWIDQRSLASSLNDVYAQRVLDNGTIAWTENGVPVCTATNNQYNPRIVPDDADGALITWYQTNGSNYDVYAQRIGQYGWPKYWEPTIASVQDVPGDEGGRVRIAIDRSVLDNAAANLLVDEYNVWQQVNDPVLAAKARAAGRTILRSGENAPAGFPAGTWELVGNFAACQQAQYLYRATTLIDSTAAGNPLSTYFVSAHTTNPLIWTYSPSASGYSVDNLPPGAPAALAGEQSYAPAGLALSWDVNRENDLSRYAVHRATSADFVPEPGNLVASPDEPEWFDDEWTWNGGYYYKVAAVDVHGNVSAYAALSPDNVTGVEAPKAPAATYLAQNFPNPFNPTTKIVFGLSAPAHVSLRIYEASGRLVRELVNETRMAARYEEVWDGRDGAERQVASGIYFYRLDAGSFTQTRKMILLR